MIVISYHHISKLPCSFLIEHRIDRKPTKDDFYGYINIIDKKKSLCVGTEDLQQNKVEYYYHSLHFTPGLFITHCQTDGEQ